ncbi:hypothetical protein [Saccharothrix saharensis]|nr:hypothetical protein [Saccharothrix saharensis]
MRARARTTPNAWLHVVDPDHRVSTAVPPAEAVIGRYLVDHRGEITDQYVPNPRYRPAPPPPAHPATRPPVAAGAPPRVPAPPAAAPGATARAADRSAADRSAADVEPANELEAVLRLVHQGELGRNDLLAAVLAAELVLPADPARPSRGHLVTRGAVVDAFASPKALPGDWPPRWHLFTGVELAVVFDRLGEPLRLNLGDSAGLSWEITSDALVTALRGTVGTG